MRLGYEDMKTKEFQPNAMKTQRKKMKGRKESGRKMLQRKNEEAIPAGRRKQGK